MMSWLKILVAGLLAVSSGHVAAAELKIASPQRGSWEGAVPELGRDIFKKHGLDLDILYTAGGGETLQAVISGAVDIGLSAGTLAILGAFQKGAPVRIVGASSTGSRELFWYVVTDSPVQAMRDANDRTIAYSTAGSSTNIAVLRFIEEFSLKARPVATGDVSATITQVMTRQVDVGWSVAPFNLKPLEEGKIRIIARASDLAAIRQQTIRVQIANLAALTQKRDSIERFVRAYRETLDWMYASPEALQKYLRFSGFGEAEVRRTLSDFIPKDSLQTENVSGLDEAMADAVRFKYLSAPLTAAQLAELIRIPR
jgi:ABC-type nitrate/sulfonate/bicarbonate transport system substrate-binding protein